MVHRSLFAMLFASLFGCAATEKPVASQEEAPKAAMKTVEAYSQLLSLQEGASVTVLGTVSSTQWPRIIGIHDGYGSHFLLDLKDGQTVVFINDQPPSTGRVLVTGMIVHQKATAKGESSSKGVATDGLKEKITSPHYREVHVLATEWKSISEKPNYQ